MKGKVQKNDKPRKLGINGKVFLIDIYTLDYSSCLYITLFFAVASKYKLPPS